MVKNTKKNKSLRGVVLAKGTTETITTTPGWETKLKEKFTINHENNGKSHWLFDDSVDEVIAFIKEELNAPIELYKKQLATMHINRLKLILASGHGGGNWRRLLLESIADIQKELTM